MHLVIIFICLIFSIFSCFGVNYISEIDFGDIEYVEIYSNQSLNLLGNKVYDENLDKFNELELIQKKNSSYYLIVGNKFVEEYDISKFNCSIYVTDKSQVSNGGLKSSGENLTLEINSSLNLSYAHLNNFNFEFNTSLNYNLLDGSYYVSNKSICFKNFNYSKNIKKTLNNMSLDKDAISFDLEIEDFLVFDKVSFDFDTNVSNFTINYWIEDYLGNVVKSKRNTTNLNSKSWSPKGISNVYLVKGILQSDNLSLNISKMFYYYSNETYLTDLDEEELNEEKDISKIIIKNEDDLIQGKTTVLKYSIYKGNILKRVIYFYLNGKKIHSINLNKYSSLNGEIDLKNYLIEGKNELIIKGLDLEIDLEFMSNNVFYNKFENNNLLNSNKNLYFSSILQNNSLILFNLFSNIEDKEIFCYVNYGRIRVSNELKFDLKEKKYNLKLQVNDSKLKEKSFSDGDFLKLICKYNQSNYFKYLTEEFNYFFPKEINNQIKSDSKINFYSFNEGQNKSFKNDLNFSKKIILIDENLSQNNSFQIKSNNLMIKENSFYFLFSVLVLLVCILVLRW